MSFQQVFYTSCETGLGGGRGYQVNAASSDIPPSTMEMVIRLGRYTPPLSAPSFPTAEEIEQFPVALLFQTLGDGSAVLGQAKYLGLDYSKRDGNFFTHSLVSVAPDTDFRENNRILPIEMWRSGVWVTTESETTELPKIESISSGDRVDFREVQKFTQNAARRERLAGFLTASVEALKTSRRIIIIDDNENIAFWIAAASYALPFHLVLKLTFNTYVKDPYKAEALITGTTEDSGFRFAPHEVEYQYFVFDTKGGRFTNIEPNGFASKAAFMYGLPDAAPIARFAGFVEEVAPDLELEDLDDALSTYGYFENIDLPDVNDVKVLSWCSKYLSKLANRDFEVLFAKVTAKSPVNSETLNAATDFYLAALNSQIETQGIYHIESLYFQWLISEASRTADASALEENVKKLPRRVDLREDTPNFPGDWYKTLRDCDDPARFALVLRIGDLLGFLESENEILRWVGKTVAAKWLKDLSIQESVRRVSNQSGGRLLLEGIAEFLVGQIDDISLFNSLTSLVTDQNAFRILSDYAVANENLPLFLRLGGTKTNLLPNSNDRIDALRYLLADVQQIFQTEITAAIVQSAFDAVWLDRAPTIDEAVQLVSTELREYVLLTDIPPRLLDLINPEIEPFPPAEAALIRRLASNEVYHTLGDKAGTAQVYRIIAEMQQPDFIDPDGVRIIEAINWAAENRPHIAPVVCHLQKTLGQKFIKVKNIQTQAQNLPGCAKEPTGEFFRGYRAEAERILQTKENHLEIARLLRTWALAAYYDQPAIGKHLLDWSEIILKSQSRKEIENIEKVLDEYTLEVWTTTKDHLKEQNQGMLRRLIGGFVGKKSEPPSTKRTKR